VVNPARAGFDQRNALLPLPHLVDGDGEGAVRIPCALGGVQLMRSSSHGPYGTHGYRYSATTPECTAPHSTPPMVRRINGHGPSEEGYRGPNLASSARVEPCPRGALRSRSPALAARNPPPTLGPATRRDKERTAHLPIYVWGRNARLALQLAAGGYGLGATMHADSLDEATDLLRGELGATDAELAALTVYLQYSAYRTPAGTYRRVEEAWHLRADAEGRLAPVRPGGTQGGPSAHLTR